jgi:hypothetical protein
MRAPAAIAALPWLAPHAHATATRPSPPTPRRLQTLYSFPGDFRALKALIAAQYNGVEIVSP